MWTNAGDASKVEIKKQNESDTDFSIEFAQKITQHELSSSVVHDAQ